MRNEMKSASGGVKTKTIKINKKKPEKLKILKAAAILKRGGVVAFPTDTVYGIGVNAINKDAIEKIYRIKKRDINKPLIILVGRKSDAKKIITFSTIVSKVIKNLWPGKLTIVGKLKNKTLSHLAKNGTIGVRMPKNKIYLALAKSCKFTVATTSANISGGKNSTSAQEVVEKLNDKIDLIINGGRTDSAQPSTVVDATGDKPKIIRKGELKKLI